MWCGELVEETTMSARSSCGGQLLEADGAAAEALREPDRAVVAAVGDEDGLDAPGGERTRGQLGGLAGADQEHAALARASPSVRVASSTAAEGTLIAALADPVSVRTRLPAASAPRKSRLRIAPVAPSTSASS